MGFSSDFESSEPSRAQIEARNGPLVLEFGAPWCGHCQAALPLIKSAFEAYPDIPHLKIEDGKGKPLGRSFRVKLWPTLIFLDSGQEVVRLVRPSDSQSISEGLRRLAPEDIDSAAIRASE